MVVAEAEGAAYGVDLGLPQRRAQRILVGEVTAGSLDRAVEDECGVVGIGREFAGLAPIDLLEALGELLVEREGKIERPVARRDQADRRLALRLAHGIVDQREAAVERHRLGQASLVVLLHESDREPARIEGEDRIRLEARDAGELGGEIELVEWRVELVENLTLERMLEA